MKHLMIILVLMVPITGCRVPPVYDIYLCPRCGPIDGGSFNRNWPCTLEAGHRLGKTPEGASDQAAPCPVCGEFLDLITSNKSDGFVAPVEVVCEATGRTIEAKRDPDYPWDYICSSCGKVALRRQETVK